LPYECPISPSRRDALLAFYDFPAEHWKHLRTTNPIESTFATVRHRTIRSKGCLSNKTALAMVFMATGCGCRSGANFSGRPRQACGNGLPIASCGTLGEVIDPLLVARVCLGRYDGLLGHYPASGCRVCLPGGLGKRICRRRAGLPGRLNRLRLGWHGGLYGLGAGKGDLVTLNERADSAFIKDYAEEIRVHLVVDGPGADSLLAERNTHSVALLQRRRLRLRGDRGRPGRHLPSRSQ
jgi:hypothetical protein